MSKVIEFKIICIKPVKLNWIEFKIGDKFLYRNKDTTNGETYINYLWHLNDEYIGWVDANIIIDHFITIAEFAERRNKQIDSILE